MVCFLVIFFQFVLLVANHGIKAGTRPVALLFNFWVSALKKSAKDGIVQYFVN